MKTKIAAIFLLTVFSSPAYSQVAKGADLALDAYTCEQFITEAGHPNTAARLLRSMMLVSWATGYAAAHDASHIRADKNALRIMSDAVGKICLAHPKRIAVKAISIEIDKVTKRNHS